jgi:hypothetical protein
VLHSGESVRRRTTLSGWKIVYDPSTPFEITVYKVGDQYVAARSNEFVTPTTVE